MIPVVSMNGICKTFANVVANDHVDFDLFPGEVHSLVGENGAGKSTLMRILYGEYAPDSGTISIDGKTVHYNISGAMKHGIAMVYQNFMQVEQMTILENVIMSHTETKFGFIDFKTAREKIQKYLTQFRIKASPDTSVARLSVGEKQRIEIIKALYFGARILILDEPTAVLTPQETDELFEIIRDLKQSGTSIVFISHKLREVVAISDRISVLSHGKVTGSFNSGVTEVDIARAMIGKDNIKLLKNEQKQVASDKEVLSAKGLWFFDDKGVPWLRDFSFSVQMGEILGIGGVEGNGQSELLNILIGSIKPYQGSLNYNGQDITRLSIAKRRDLGISVISDDRIHVGLSVNSSLDENLVCGLESKSKYSKYGFLKNKVIRQLTDSLIREFDIRGIGEKNSISGMSGGNLQKIVLARELSRNPKLLVAAQPTRGLDIGAINFVREKILEQKDKGTAVILISADLEELMSVSDRIIIMYEGQCSGEVRNIASTTEAEIGLMMGGAHE